MDLHLDTNLIQEKWQDFKQSLSKTWHKITDADWDHTRGNTEEISTLIQKEYGHDRKTVNRSLNSMYDDFLAADAIRPVDSPPTPREPVDRTVEDLRRLDWESEKTAETKNLGNRDLTRI